MRIAQVSPLFESVPPKLYGGTERIVSYLTEELVRQGHEVTLFGTADSCTNAKLISPWHCSLRSQKNCQDQLAHHFKMLEMVVREKDEFDIIHYHIDYWHFPLSRRIDKPNVTTLHGRLDLTEIGSLYEEYSDMPVISISESQRIPVMNNNWVGTVYHGIPEETYHFNPGKGKYLAFIGRISPEKRPDRAIEIAKRTGIPLKIAAKVDRKDRDYYDEHIKHLLNHPLIEYIGEIGEAEKSEFLGNAMTLLFPIDWPEPFGLVMIEAMACGTPVIAWRNGSVPEIVNDGISGFIVDSLEEAVIAVQNVESLSRNQIRNVFKERFSVKRMMADYLNCYEQVITAYEMDRTNLRVSNL